MYKQAIADISEIFDKNLSDFMVFADTHPDDPLIEIDPIDISHKDYEQFTQDKMTFIAGDFEYIVWLPLIFQKDFENERAFPKTPDGKYQTNSISIEKTGLIVEGVNRWFCEVPPVWEELCFVLPNNFKLTGLDAVNFWQWYWLKVIDYRVTIFTLAIRRDPMVLCHLRVEAPYLLDHPAIQNELVEAFRLGKIPEPRINCRANYQITQNIFELYHIVYFYRFQGMTIEDSCAEAIEKYGNLVPNEWIKDAYGTLKKRITRMDKYNRISLKNELKSKKRQ